MKDMTKRCSKCEMIKLSAEFTKDNRYADGLFCWCKECKKRHARENPQISTNWTAKNRARSKAIKAKYVAENPEEVKKSKNKWSAANPKKELAKVRKYQASKLQATPKWLTKEQIQEMVTIYESCPIGYEVDHRVPLRGKDVRGLHVPWNLQYLPITVNRRKSNKY